MGVLIMKSFFLYYFFFILICPFAKAQINFKTYCKQYLKNPDGLSESIAHTTKVLYELSQKKTCEEAFEPGSV